MNDSTDESHLRPPLWLRVAVVSGFVGAGIGIFLGVMEVAFGVSDLLGGFVLFNGMLVLFVSLMLAGCLLLLRPGKPQAPWAATAFAVGLAAILWLNAVGVDLGSPLSSTLPFDPKDVLFPASTSGFLVLMLGALWISPTSRRFTRRPVRGQSADR